MRKTSIGKVEDATPVVWATIGDGHGHLPPIVTILDQDARTKREPGVGSSHGVGVERATIGCCAAVEAIPNAIVRRTAAFNDGVGWKGHQRGSESSGRRKKEFHQEKIKS